VKGGLINGLAPDTTIWTNYLCDILEHPSNFSHNVPADSPDNIAAATIGAARTNPSRPSADIPVNLLELGQLGYLFKSAGKSFLGSFGSNYLRSEFGVKPIARDLYKLFYFKNILNSRINELKRLNSQGGLKRTVAVYRGSQTAPVQNWVYQSNFGFFSGGGHWTTTELVKVHCRWLHAASFFPCDTDDGDLVKQATNAILGLSTTQWDTYWEALPWSWLIDWMSTCGTFFQATRNIVPASLSSVSVMRHTRSEYVAPASNINGTAQCSAWTAIREDKSRVLSTIFPTATMNFLTEDQMAIVASLAIRKL